MKKVSLLFLATAFAVSCSDETTVYQDKLQDDIVLEDSEAKLLSSVNYDKAGVLDIFDENNASGKSSKNSAEEQAGDYPLTLIAQINPPTRSGYAPLTASHVDVVGDYAYVAYNTVEDGYAGAIDIINVSNPNRPRVTSRLFYLNADVNSIKYENGYVYAVGGVDSETSVRATSNSFVAKIPVSGGRLDISSIAYGFQEGYNATDIVISDNKVLVTSGRNGYLVSYNKSTVALENEVSFDDLRSVAVNGDKIAVLDASSGVKLLNQNFDVTGAIAIDSDFGVNTKRTLDFVGDNIIVSEGSKGAGVYDASGALLEYIPIFTNPNTGVADQDVVTNAVATNDNVILMANGGAGLCLSEDNGNNADLVGIIELESSINYVASKGDYIFAAAGSNGLQIIKLNRPDENLAAQCATSPAYSGSARLIVNEGETFAYRGSKRFNTIKVNGGLLLCGSWTSRNSVDIYTNALFEMNGTLVVGRNHKRRKITVGQGATFRVEGNLTIYGDLVLEDGATIDFVGNSSVVNIFGRVVKSASAVVEGDFEDVQNKF